MPRGAAIPVYLERGAKRTFAGAIEWPGWARSGKDEASALQALLDSAPRYAKIVGRGSLDRTPKEIADLEVVERLKGSATTDFGAPAAVPSADERPVDPADLRQINELLGRYWRAFDDAVGAGRGKALRKGPRGGGRPLTKIVQHVLEADAGYLSALGWKYRLEGSGPRAIEATRKAMLEGIAASSRGEIPAAGPRGGVRWKPRFVVRRSGWHILDHAWEIEDRSS